MYETAADVTGVLIARATGMSFGDAVSGFWPGYFDTLGWGFAHDFWIVVYQAIDD